MFARATFSKLVVDVKRLYKFAIRGGTCCDFCWGLLYSCGASLGCDPVLVLKCLQCVRPRSVSRYHVLRGIVSGLIFEVRCFVGFYPVGYL